MNRKSRKTLWPENTTDKSEHSGRKVDIQKKEWILEWGRGAVRRKSDGFFRYRGRKIE